MRLSIWSSESLLTELGGVVSLSSQAETPERVDDNGTPDNLPVVAVVLMHFFDLIQALGGVLTGAKWSPFANVISKRNN